MKILLISWYFPPSNTMGALRVGKLAKYLLAQGHDVTVLSARDVPRPQNLPQDFPESQVVRTNWLDINRLPKAVANFRRSVFRSEKPSAAARSGGDPETDPYLRRRWSRSSFASCLGSLYMDLVNVPDKYVGWSPHAVSAGKDIIGRDRPDVIFASGPPFSAFIVAYWLAGKFNIPWVAELRDRWSDDPYYPPIAWRGWLLRKMEEKLLGNAACLVTVSEPWMASYEEKYDKPILAIYNGYDPDDFRVPGTGSPGSGKLNIVHTGRIYPGRRDPTPLFQAVSLLDEPSGIRISFIGAEDADVMPLAEKCGVAHLVETHPHRPYGEALEAQKRADVLLLMQWNDPREQGNVPGKLFEYLATRRPILGLGLEAGLPASIIRAREAGFFSNRPQEIADRISDWSKQKREKGELEMLPESVCKGFSRDEQFNKLEVSMTGLVANSRNTRKI
jgi:glycosyltransferase involved in cell wall biosynthesis